MKPWLVSLSPLCERRFWRIYETNNDVWDLFESFEDELKVDPRSCGEPHPNFVNNRCWVHEFPHLARFPRLSVLYTIDDENEEVILWALRSY